MPKFEEFIKGIEEEQPIDREKYKKQIIPPSDISPFWGFEDPYTKYVTRHKTEDEAYKYADENEKINQKHFNDERDRMVADYKEGKVTQKDIRSFMRSDYGKYIVESMLKKLAEK